MDGKRELVKQRQEGIYDHDATASQDGVPGTSEGIFAKSFVRGILMHCSSEEGRGYMILEIVEETHNRVRWTIDTQLVQILIGIGLAVAISVALILVFPNLNFLVWVVLLGVAVGGAGIILLLVLLKPISEKGLVERTPTGGVVRREERLLLRGEHVLFEFPLEEVAGFWVEQHDFEQSGGNKVRLARLWILFTTEGEGQPLIDWMEVPTVQRVAEAIARATRRPLTQP